MLCVFSYLYFFCPSSRMIKWSRFSGGSGAPYWTLVACGFNPRNFTATQAAILHSEYPVAHKPAPETLPAMIWSTNYGRLISQTVFTLFFAGKDYAPKCIIDGQNIQDYLQSHFIAAFGELADRIRDAGDLLDECVIGWDSMNEPAEGFCGYEDLRTVPAEQGSTLRMGSRPTPAQSLRLGMGQTQTTEHWSFGMFGPKCDGTVTIDPKGHKAWLEPEVERDGVNERWGWRRDPGWKLGICIWALHGVWDVESGYILQPGYFRSPPFDPDRPVVFEADYWRPHWRAYSARIRQAHPETIHFIQPPVFAIPPPLDDDDDLRGRCCYSGHYYDGLTLVTRHWNWFNADTLGLLRGKYSSPVFAAKFGEKAIRKSIQEQLGYLKKDCDILGSFPTLIGEIGTPFDMDGKRSYGWTDNGKYAGDYSNQQKALDASLNGADGPNRLNYTIWTYCPDSSHEWGDGWNMEDLSLWSRDDLRTVSLNERYRMRDADASSVRLLTKREGEKGDLATVRVKSVPFGTPNESAVSLQTLGMPSLSPSYESLPDARKGRTERLDIPCNSGSSSKSVPGNMKCDGLSASAAANPHWANPYDFLTDGARAVKAFARPFPTATVGTPVNIEFDATKSEFKLTVRVRPEDRPLVGDSSGFLSRRAPPSSSGTTSTDETSSSVTLNDSNMCELPTEVFLPLVHFARDDIVQRSFYYQTSQSQSSSPDDTSPPTPSPLSTTSSATLSPSTSLIDITVTCSPSTVYSIEGQTLRWWYVVPAEGSASESGDDAVEYTLTVKRRSGPIIIKDATTQGMEGRSKKAWSFCERLCPPDSSCVIM